MSTSSLWLLAYLWPPAAMLFFAVAPRLRWLLQRIRPSGARRQRRVKVVVSEQRQSKLSGASAANSLTVQVRSSSGSGAVVTLDGRMSGAALLQRAKACLGQSLKGLKLPGSDILVSDQTLLAQGLVGGEVLEAFGDEQQAMPVMLQRPRQEIGEFKFTLRENKGNPYMSRFQFTIDARHAAQAIADATMDTVRAQIEEDSISLTIHGRTTDFTLHRRLGVAHHATGGGILPAGFAICPARCSLVVSDGERIVIEMRPFPEDWLPPGTRVSIHGLKQHASERLNGLAGTVLGYVEPANQSPERYSVQLDAAVLNVKKVKRCNLKHVQQSHSADVAAGGARESLSKVEETAVPCPDSFDSGPAWSRARRHSGIEAKRLRLLEVLH